MLEVKEIKLTGLKGFALYNEPIYFINQKNRNYRQVFYNSNSDYGYWKPETALDYTSYINSNGYTGEWESRGNKFLLFYDPNPPEHWKGYNYLLFVETKKLEIKKYIDIFNKEQIEITKELIDCSYQVSIYNKKRTLNSILSQKERDLQRTIEQYKQHREWMMEKELMEKEWKFKSQSDPSKLYQVKYQKYEKGYRLSCNCPVWIYNHRKDRTCNHTDMVIEMGNEYFKKGDK